MRYLPRTVLNMVIAWTDVDRQIKASAGVYGGLAKIAKALGVSNSAVCRRAAKLGAESKHGENLRRAREEHGTGFKTCTRCGKRKALADFWFCAGKSSPQSGKCKKCLVASRRDTLRGNLARTTGHRRGGVSLDTLERLFNDQSGLCHYSGKPMSIDTIDTCPSVDRVDSRRGYVAGNIVLCCYRVNMMKNTADYETFIRFCHAVATKHPRP